jgi:hypothetical protein
VPSNDCTGQGLFHLLTETLHHLQIDPKHVYLIAQMALQITMGSKMVYKVNLLMWQISMFIYGDMSVP